MEREDVLVGVFLVAAYVITVVVTIGPAMEHLGIEGATSLYHYVAGMAVPGILTAFFADI